MGSVAVCMTKGNGFKLKEGRFSRDIWKKFFMVRGVNWWNSLPRKIGDAPSLGQGIQSQGLFKVRPERALSNLI